MECDDARQHNRLLGREQNSTSKVSSLLNAFCFYIETSERKLRLTFCISCYCTVCRNGGDTHNSQTLHSSGLPSLSSWQVPSSWGQFPPGFGYKLDWLFLSLAVEFSHSWILSLFFTLSFQLFVFPTVDQPLPIVSEFLFLHIYSHESSSSARRRGLLSILAKIKIVGYGPEVAYICTSDQPYSGKALIPYSADGVKGYWHWEPFLPTVPGPGDQALHVFLNGHWLWHSWPQRQTEPLAQAHLAVVVGDPWMRHTAVLTWHAPFKFSFRQSCLSRYQEDLGYLGLLNSRSPHLPLYNLPALPRYLSQVDHLPSPSSLFSFWCLAPVLLLIVFLCTIKHWAFALC